MENENSNDQTAEGDATADNAEHARRLGEGLKEARQCYDDVRHKAADRLREARETTLGDVFDRVLVTVKRHPRGSLAVAAALGFFLGRFFRR